ncbi:hypothetical protein AZ66_25405, partial [Paenibacillus sp. E194]|uniref:non-ribosomal peptide synthetase n=1 Tax=Paenibacillus sp. E194 TaxID=1458845 RepID=UPI0005CB07E2
MSKYEKEFQYWDSFIDSDDALVSIPYEHTSFQYDSGHMDSTSFLIRKDLSERIMTMGKRSYYGAYLILLTGVHYLLYRYTSNRSIITGIPAFKEDKVADQGVNDILFVKSNSEASTSFKDLLLQMKNQLQAVSEHQNVPLYEITKRLNVPHNSKGQPIINTIVDLENIHSDEYRNSAETNMLLHFQVNEDDSIQLNVVYKAGLYTEATASRIFRNLERLLMKALAEVDQVMDHIELLSESEKLQLLQFNETKTDYPEDKTIHELFEEQVEKTPEQTAIVFDKQRLTYRQLNDQANGLARELREQGVRPDKIVGIMAERSLEMVVGIFAILKAGGAYLPIDPGYPEERVRYILEDSGALLLLIQSHLKERLRMEEAHPFQAEEAVRFDGAVLELVLHHPANGEGATVCLEELPLKPRLAPLPEIVSRAPSETISGPHHLAYVIYTSGSTGKPKGVMIEHHSLVNRLKWMQKSYPLSGMDVILQKTPFTFDVSVWELFWWALEGAQLCLLEPGGEKDPGTIVEAVREHQVTTMHFVPSMLHVFLEHIGNRVENVGLSTLKQVFASGEALQAAHVQRFHQLLGESHGTKLTNLYGPTEATIDVTYFDCDPGTEGSSVPIGKPIDNTRMYVLDEQMRMQSIGVSGELYIAGVGLARGYLNRPELTEERFVADPFISGERMYRTGDLGRWQPDGNIEYLGRIDHQVKIRGYRIELGEIEACLQQHETVKEAVVIARQDAQGDAYLCAYTVMEGNLDAAELSRMLGEQVPSYMIPSFFVQLDQMPLTSNGKLDRRALPEPKGNAAAAAEYVAARTDLEARLAEIWQRVLSMERIGVKDNFFTLGGHSLKAATIVAQIHKQLHINAPLGIVFEHPTVELLAQELAGMEQQIFAAIVPAEAKEYYPVSSAQKRMYILNQLEGAELTYNMPGVYAVEGSLHVERLEQAFLNLIMRHESLRTSFRMVNGEPMQHVHEQVPFAVEMESLSEQERSADTMEEQIAGRVEAFVRPFDLEQAPLLRVGLIEVAAERHILLFDMHHIICDGISMNVLMQEFSKLYRGESLPELRVQYKDYAVWQQGLTQSKTMKKQETFWLETFADEIPVLELPTDYARPAVQSFEGNTIYFDISKIEADGLQKIAADTGATMYMVLLAAYTTLLSKYTGQEDIIVGTPIAGRPHADLENLIGMFVGTLALRNYPAGDLTFVDFVQNVKASALKAFEHQDYPFEELIEKLDLRKDLSRNPLFDAMFVMQNMDQSDIEIEGICFNPYRTKDKEAKFDLTLNAVEKEGGFVFGIQYRKSLFCEETMERWTGHFKRLLQVVAEQPERRLCEIEILSEQERRQIVFEFNDTFVAYPQRTLHSLVEEQAEKTPDQVAVVFGEQRLTYRELNGRANCLARTLIDRGVQPNDVVSLITGRSLEMIIAILGILKAGGSFLPIDPEYPEERIRFILSDSSTKMLLIKKGIHLNAPDFHGNTIILDEQKLQSEAGNLVSTAQNQIAYIIYTSGTTGTPKGVLIEHQGIVNTVMWRRDEYRLSQQDIVLNILSFAFDAFISTLFSALISGAQSVILPDGEAQNPVAISASIAKHSVTRFVSGPALFSVLMEHASSEDLRSLITVTLGGEHLSIKIAEKVKDAYPWIELVNEYGPTENSVVSSCFRQLNNAELITVGKPISNVHLYVMNRYGQPQPIGVAG